MRKKNVTEDDRIALVYWFMLDHSLYVNYTQNASFTFSCKIPSSAPLNAIVVLPVRRNSYLLF